MWGGGQHPAPAGAGITFPPGYLPQQAPLANNTSKAKGLPLGHLSLHQGTLEPAKGSIASAQDADPRAEIYTVFHSKTCYFGGETGTLIRC